MYNIGYLLFFRSSLFKIFRNVLCNKRRKEQMGYKTNYSYLYNVICVHVNCGSARNGTILIKKSSGKNENTFYLEDFYFKNLQHSAGFLCQHISHIIVFVTRMTFDFFKLYVYFGFDFVVIISVGYCAFLVGFPFSGTPF